MNGFARIFALVLLSVVSALGEEPNTAEVIYAKKDTPLTLDSASPLWRGARPVFIEKDSFGNPSPALRTEVRARWTDHNLYFLFTCPYKQLHLKPDPNTHAETNKLWNWDVAEAFIGSDFADIQRYKEFEVSPQGEWVDLDIDLHKPHHEDGWKWNSDFRSQPESMRMPMFGMAQ